MIADNYRDLVLVFGGLAVLPDRPALLVSDLNVLCHYRYGDVV